MQARTVAAPPAQQYQGVQGMDIDENQHFDHAIRAGMAAAAASLSTPQAIALANAQANANGNRHKYVRVNDGTFSVSSSVKHKPKRTKTDRHGDSSSQAAMPPPPPRININHTNTRASPGPTPGVPPAAGLPTKDGPPAYTSNKPPPVRTTASPFMHPIESPFQEVATLQDESDDSDYEDNTKDDDAETIYEEMSASTDSYMAQLAQQKPPANMRVIQATPKETPGIHQRFTNMGPHPPPSTRSTRSHRSIHSRRSAGNRSTGSKTTL